MSRARTFADLATASEEGSLSNKNIIYNGDMAVAQRATSVTGITSCGTNYFTCDRWGICEAGDATITIAQSSVSPEGFNNSLKLDVTTADTSLATTQYMSFFQKFEGLDLQQLNWGTSNAKSVTLSFHVKSNKTGTYVVNLTAADATNKYQSQTYTIDSADTWEKKTITYIGETTTAIPDDNTDGALLEWGLASGTAYTSGGATGKAWSSAVTSYFGGLNVNILDHTDNEFLLTGVQLEVGQVATPFEHIDFATNLAKCQRYYQKSYNYGTAPGTGTTVGEIGNDGNPSSGSNTGQLIDFHSFYCEMRDTPTMTFYDIAGTSGKVSTVKHGTNEYNGETGDVFRGGAKNYSVQRPATGNDVNSIRWHFTATAEL